MQRRFDGKKVASLAPKKAPKGVFRLPGWPISTHWSHRGHFRACLAPKKACKGLFCLPYDTSANDLSP